RRQFATLPNHDERGRDALPPGRRRHQWHRALEERRDGRRHGPGPGHQPRRRQLRPPLPDERERDALLRGRRRHQWHRALEERRHGRWHGPGPGHQPRRRQLTALRPEERERDALLQRLRTNDGRRTLGRRDRDLIHDHLHVHHHDHLLHYRDSPADDHYHIIDYHDPADEHDRQCDVEQQHVHDSVDVDHAPPDHNDIHHLR